MNAMTPREFRDHNTLWRLRRLEGAAIRAAAEQACVALNPPDDDGRALFVATWRRQAAERELRLAIAEAGQRAQGSS